MDKGTVLKSYGLSYNSIALAIGKSKTHVHGILQGEREDIHSSRLIREFFVDLGMKEGEISLFPFRSCGEEASLQRLLENDVLGVRLNSSKELFLSQSFNLGLSAMKEAIELRKFIAIIGETGSGKTTLVRYFEELCLLDGNKIISRLQNLDFARVSFRQIYEAIHFDISSESARHSTEALIRQVRLRLSSLYKGGKKVVLLVDEAHRIDRGTLFALKDVWESSVGFAKLIGIILLGQEGLSTKLDDGKVEEVDSRVERYNLCSISSEEEVRNYVEGLCGAVGISSPSDIIDDDVYGVLCLRRSNFIGINILLRRGIELSLMAGLLRLSSSVFKNI